ncbi:hypothetical protein RHGRI_000305 [Rhododendron griersonianum]|uniref:RNase H type-1 domain-containing protein n=1 Tax=Rhododendron griersonianum TaxID=479676 RepID=A0AAV6LG48_9ERIC|nr:hypothetical protein RHGRI_000305 [Rhododendron griersonianum]
MGSPPLQGSFKPNTDGFYDVGLRTGNAGGLIRDCHGSWVVGFQRKNVTASSSTVVECRALRDVLQLARERNLQGICVETDSMTSVQLISKKEMGSHEFSNIFSDCRVLLDRLKAKVHHVYREANRSADAIAKANFSNICNSLVVIQSIDSELY